MDSSTRVVVNTGIQYVRTVVQVAIMLYTSRVVLDNLGVEDYGIYNLVGGVIAMLSFIQINLANTTIRYLSYHHGKNDMPMVIKIFNNSLCIQLFFGLVICVLLVCATDFVFANMLNIYYIIFIAERNMKNAVILILELLNILCLKRCSHLWDGMYMGLVVL